MIKVILPNFLGDNFRHVTDEVLLDVCRIIFNMYDFDKEFEERSTGQYFKVLNTETEELHFVAFNNSNNSRNTRLIQPFPPVYKDFLNSSSSNKHLDIYFINPETSDRTQYAKLFYRCFMTIGVSFLNFDILGLTGLFPYESYNDLKIERNINRDRNSHNASSYFEDNDDDVTIFGKTDGVNEKESFILALTISCIVKRSKPVIFFPIKTDMPKIYKSILEESGITFEPAIKTLISGQAKAEATADIDDIRNTKIYHLNLLNKFGDKQCYLCGCDVEHMIIGAHIERVADIKRSTIYSQEEKLERAVDGDNGFWLCANHDKMFEFGIIYFRGRNMAIGSFISNNMQKSFIEKSILEMRKTYFPDPITLPFTIESTHYNSRVRDYLEKHVARVA